MNTPSSQPPETPAGDSQPAAPARDVHQPETPARDLAPPVLTLVHDITHLGSWLAVLNILALPRELLARVGFRGFEHIGVDMIIRADLQTKASWTVLEPQFAAHNEHPRLPTHLPPTYRAHAVIDWAMRQGCGPEMVQAIYQAFWTYGHPIHDIDTLCNIATYVCTDSLLGHEPDHPSDQVRTLLEDKPLMMRFRRDMMQARTAHIGGVPVIQVAGTLQPGLLTTQDFANIITSLS